MKENAPELLRRELSSRKWKSQVRAIRGGRLNESEFGSRMEGQGIFAEQIAKMFEVACRKAGIPERGPHLSTAAFRRPVGKQMEMFG